MLMNGHNSSVFGDKRKEARAHEDADLNAKRRRASESMRDVTPADWVDIITVSAIVRAPEMDPRLLHNLSNHIAQIADEQERAR